jgi:signal transduction histidine kinase
VTLPFRPMHTRALGLSIETFALCSWVAAVRHQAHQDALEAAEALAGARTRLLLAESTASLGRLAAGLLHELNSPIGALASGLSTLLVLARKQATAPPEQQPVLHALRRHFDPEHSRRRDRRHGDAADGRIVGKGRPRRLASAAGQPR